MCQKAPTFRHEMYAEYKGTRKPMPEELRQQVPVIREILEAYEYKDLFSGMGFEADDILGTMAKKAEKEEFTVSVVSGDRDLLQLVTDKTTVRIPKTKAGKTIVENYDPSGVIQKYGITPPLDH